ncbi:irregular chiasm C-roughest protein teiresias [Musca autumnalis]|uniref:irregular chiasm C-roughest protein teiresias n=1 Tax=Musca autumnalis TaxID=221902 RepID=UPI003CE9066A
MRPTFDRSLYILLFIILIQCISYTQQQNIKPQLHQQQQQQHRPTVAKEIGIVSNSLTSSTLVPTDTSRQWSRKYTTVNEDYNHLMQTNNNNNKHQTFSNSEEEEQLEQEEEIQTDHNNNNKHQILDDNKLKQLKLHKDFYYQQQEKQKQQLREQQQRDMEDEDDAEDEEEVEEEMSADDEILSDHYVNNKEKCAKNCKPKQETKQMETESQQKQQQLHTTNNQFYHKTKSSLKPAQQHHHLKDDHNPATSSFSSHSSSLTSDSFYTSTSSSSSPSSAKKISSSSTASLDARSLHKQPSQLPLKNERNVYSNSKQNKKQTPAKISLKAATKKEHQRIHVAHRLQHKEVKKTHNRESKHKANIRQQQHRDSYQTKSFKYGQNQEGEEEEASELQDEKQQHKTKRTRRETEEVESKQSLEEDHQPPSTKVYSEEVTSTTSMDLEDSSKPSITLDQHSQDIYLNQSMVSGATSSLSIAPTNSIMASTVPLKTKRSHTNVRVPVEVLNTPKEAMVIIDEVEEYEGAAERQHEYAQMGVIGGPEDYPHDEEPRMLPLRPILPNPYNAEEMSVVYAEQHSEIRLMCEVDLDISSSMWYKNTQVVHAMDRTTRVTDYRFIKEANGALTISNVMLEDDGKWQCEAENTRHYTENARPVKLVVLDRPKPPYLLIDGRRLDAGNIFVPVKENSELNLACVSEGGNPRPTLTWEVLLSPGVDRHAQKVSAEVLELEEIKNEKDKNTYKINSGAKSEARLPAVFRAHHNARILCVMEHPTLKIRQNASLLLDVQYTPSFAISRTPGFGYPLREGIEVSLKCDVDSNPPSTPRWQKDDGEPPVPQTGDGFLNFTSIRREHSGWYKCTSRHLNYQYSSIGYYLSVRYDSVDVTSEPDDQDISVAAASHNPNKGQLEVQLGGSVTLQCPQGSLGCWSHLDPVTARLRGLGHGLSSPTGQVSLKDVVYQDAGTYKCIGQSPQNKKKLEVLQTVGVSVKGHPTVVARNTTPVAYPGSPLHLSVEFCANPPAHAARWLHGDRVYTPGNQYGNTVLAYGFTDLPTPFCKEARLTYVSMHERVPRTFYFIVSSPGGVAEAVIKVNFTLRYRPLANVIDEEEEELSEPEEIHFPVFGTNNAVKAQWRFWCLVNLLWLRFFV